MDNKKTRKPRAKKEDKKEPVVREAQMLVTRKYFDTKFNCNMPAGEEFICSMERAKELVNAKVAEIVCLKNSL